MRTYFPRGNWTAPFFPAVVAILTTALPAAAEVQLFQIDSGQSTLTLQGTTAGIAIKPQGTNALSAHFQGWLAVDVTSSSIQWIVGSSAVGLEPNAWQPGPRGAFTNTPANYGGTVATGSGIGAGHEVTAIRDLGFDLLSDPTALTNGQFDASAISFTIPDQGNAVMDYRYNGLLVALGQRTLSGVSASNTALAGTLAKPLEPDLGSVLTLPIDLTLPSQSTPAGETILRFTGQIVAMRGGFIAEPVLLVVPAPATDGQFTLVWDSRYRLQTTADLGSGLWSNVPGTAPLTVPFDQDLGFFRVQP